MAVRFAKDDELEQVNELRRQVNELHVEGEPEIFKPGFTAELRDHLHTIRDDPEQQILVDERDGEIVGFAVLHAIHKPETPFMKERVFLDIDEFCVDENWRRKGVASGMVDFIKEWAAQQGFRRLELNMWEFNRDALAFYEAAGFSTYRRYMEMTL